MSARTVVVTGSTRGIGLGLAREFLARGCNVVVVGRSQGSVDKALAELGIADRTLGVPGDVSKRDDMQKVWDAAAARFGTVDIWINNAGISLPSKPLWDTSEADWHQIVDINYHGAVNGSAVAAKNMLAQGSGYIWNMEGFGSNGMNRAGMAPYGSTKYALRYFTTSLVKDLKDKPVGAGFLSPGIVVTDLLVDDYKELPPQVWEKVSKTLRILADRVETVTPYLAEGVLNTDKSGARVEWLTKGKAARRFATAAWSKRDPFQGASPTTGANPTQGS
jgi:NAD(P)-dependent dehydrogenase (short-subunit alcohol dehydrogenase family)